MDNDRRTHLGWAAAIFLAVSPARSVAQEMSTIDVFIAQNRDSNNNSTEQFVGLRCTSLFAMMSVYLDQNGISDLSKEYRSASEKSLSVAIMFREKTSPDYMSNQIRIMTDAYVDRFLKAKALTGSGTEDKIIAADLKTCGFLFSK